jgi:hypothetical protein
MSVQRNVRLRKEWLLFYSEMTNLFKQLDTFMTCDMCGQMYGKAIHYLSVYNALFEKNENGYKLLTMMYKMSFEFLRDIDDAKLKTVFLKYRREYETYRHRLWGVYQWKHILPIESLNTICSFL